MLCVWLRRAAQVIDDRQDSLSVLDAVIGDGDHGANMARGFRAVAGKLDEPPPDVAALLKLVGMTLISTVGGASGPLYGTFFLDMGKAARDVSALDVPAWRTLLAAGVAGVAARGKAVAGDKTMLDALIPAVAALSGTQSGPDTPQALARAAEAARQGAEATIPMIARKGRASYLGERSAGHEDPGAASSALLLTALADTAG
ncbi:putative PTS-dependent dihydroxyacetone kinase [Gluconacetobacter diazotrophicus PA1 5]|uniref:Putative PTS-dependent dihydroxyacetone kinase n=1 Tax=Gluconacetobacter diazotrophicus (strain ATCC 49037 / DSM 5601 / CCUG 37298 / CIP 103539 / LMG 7603 / PAl5) TaxID=272568 RepID=A9H2V8_GLUDA|nr:putative PTS-dependent dihydroxyacetone kinase [Gluconacetobacter diazotrophicus PA1 5]